MFFYAHVFVHALVFSLVCVHTPKTSSLARLLKGFTEQFDDLCRTPLSHHVAVEPW